MTQTYAFASETRAGDLWLDVVELSPVPPGHTAGSAGRRWRVGLMEEDGHRYQWEDFSPDAAERLLEARGWELAGDWETQHGARRYAVAVNRIGKQGQGEGHEEGAKAPDGRMKVRMAFTVEVDLAGWSRAYGPSTAAAIRKDVRSYFENQVSQAACWEEVEGEVRWTS